jgi:uncharacterized protein (TIGR02270 family)
MPILPLCWWQALAVFGHRAFCLFINSMAQRLSRQASLFLTRKFIVNHPVIRSDLLRVHVENAGLLAWQRCLLTEAPHARITDIYELDQRLAGSFRYLQIAGSSACDMAAEVFAQTPEPGEATVLAALMMQSQALSFASDILAQMETQTAAIAALAEAFRHVDTAARRHVFYPWIKHDNPCLVSAALAAATLLRLNIGDLLLPLVADARPLVRAHAIEHAGVMGLSRHVAAAQTALDHADPDLAFAAAVACVRLGHHPAAERLADCITPKTPAAQCREAVEVAFPLLAEASAHTRVRALLQAPETHHWGLLALGTIGSTRTLPYLLREMEQLETARMAGWAFAMITGANVAEDDLELEEFPDTEDDPLLEGAAVELFFVDGLPFPDPALVLDWLQTKGRSLSAEHPLLFGLPRWSWQEMSSPDPGFQGRYRALAQIMALRSPESRLPDWRAPLHLTGGRLTRDWQT